MRRHFASGAAAIVCLVVVSCSSGRTKSLRHKAGSENQKTGEEQSANNQQSSASAALYLTWDGYDPSVDVDGFRVYAAAEGSEEFVPVAEVSADSVDVTAPGMIKSVAGWTEMDQFSADVLCFRVTAYHSDHESPPSEATCGEWTAPGEG